MKLRLNKNGGHILIAFGIFFVATILFLWPVATNISNYSEGGDHLFNAWTLARNHHCILGQGCEVYTDGNIYFPNKDSMLYSETQFSTSILTLPLFFINANPLFATNIWYLLSVFLAGFFMYLLARYLSKGNEAISILAGLVFAFCPSMISAMSHLQSLSIFYVPLIVLLLLMYQEKGTKKYLVGFGVASALLFLASWYQMVFGLLIVLAFITYVAFINKRKAFILLGVTLLAVIVTIPLAKEYMRFSKSNKAGFSIGDQIAFSSSLNDFWLPHESTPLGMAYYAIQPFVLKNSYNPDNYAYAGISLYIVAAATLIYLFKHRHEKGNRQDKTLVLVVIALFIAGVFFSLGPVLKFSGQVLLQEPGNKLAVPLPYVGVSKFLPQLSFIRAVGRASIIAVFALCCLLAISSRVLTKLPKKNRLPIIAGIVIIIAIDLLPIKRFILTPFQDIPSRRTSYTIPALYQRIRSDDTIDNLVILRAQPDYDDAGIPIARVEDVMWAGYHNKSIFNGYSGFEPKEYAKTLQDFNDLQADDLAKMKTLGIEHVLIDKELSQKVPSLQETATKLFEQKVYEDERYVLYRL